MVKKVSVRSDAVVVGVVRVAVFVVLVAEVPSALRDFFCSCRNSEGRVLLPRCIVSDRSEIFHRRLAHALAYRLDDGHCIGFVLPVLLSEFFSSRRRYNISSWSDDVASQADPGWRVTSHRSTSICGEREISLKLSCSTSSSRTNYGRFVVQKIPTTLPGSGARARWLESHEAGL